MKTSRAISVLKSQTTHNLKAESEIDIINSDHHKQIFSTLIIRIDIFNSDHKQITIDKATKLELKVEN